MKKETVGALSDATIIGVYYLAAAMLVVAGGIKLFQPGVSELLDALYEQGHLGLDTIVRISRWQPWLEILLGTWALFGIHLEKTALALAALYFFFIAAILTASQGYLFLPIDCGCFGESEGGSPVIFLILRNTGIALPLFFIRKRHRKWSLFHRLTTEYSELRKESLSTILLQEKMASIGQLAAFVVHEINTPIGFISSNIRVLEKYVSRLVEFVDAQADLCKSFNNTATLEEIKLLRKKMKVEYICKDVKDLVRESLEGTERVEKIVQDLKSFSRIGHADQSMVNLNDCLDDTINIIWNDLKYKATVKKEYGELSPTMCFPQQMNQVFMNLLVNAAQAIEKQGEIHIKTWRENDSVCVAISDTGCGIPLEIMGKLFEPFLTTKDAGKGNGLGLSICFEIIKKHDGEITVQSKVGKGSTFTVRIPIRDKERETVRQEEV